MIETYLFFILDNITFQLNLFSFAPYAFFWLQACRILQKFIEPYVGQEISTSFGNETSEVDEAAKPVSENPFSSADYSSLFGEEFQMAEDNWDSSYLNILDISAVEEGILHVLYACASQVKCIIRHIELQRLMFNLVANIIVLVLLN